MAYVVEMPAGPRVYAGAAEQLAALGVVLPWATGIFPWLTPLAAAGLVLIMVGVIVLHIRRREMPNIGLNRAPLVLAVVAYVRWPAPAMCTSRAPSQTRAGPTAAAPAGGFGPDQGQRTRNQEE